MMMEIYLLKFHVTFMNFLMLLIIIWWPFNLGPKTAIGNQLVEFAQRSGAVLSYDCKDLT